MRRIDARREAEPKADTDSDSENDETDEERLERFNREIPKLKSRLQNTSFPPIRNMLQKQIDAREKFKSQFKHAREESKSQFKQFTGTKK